LSAGAADPAARPRLGFAFWSFIVFMLALTGLFVVLGIWQVNRLAWKEGLIAEVTARLDQPAYDLPPPDQWPSLDLTTFDFHPVKVSGQYLADKTVLVFTSLGDDAKGKYSGPGYWVMTPFTADDGGIVFINRGFVPQTQASAFSSGNTVPKGHLSIIGIAVEAEAAGAFTPGPDIARHVEWVRDPVRLATMAGLSAPVIGLTIDAPAGTTGALPQGGETTIAFPNNHLGYAFTWFGFAILTPCLLAAWIWRQLRPKKS
jgi:surfeit locus 1 family protein